MKKLVAKMNFSVDGKYYIIGDEIETDNIRLIRRLNEKGFIKPLSYEELVLIERELTNNKIKLKEE